MFPLLNAIVEMCGESPRQNDGIDLFRHPQEELLSHFLLPGCCPLRALTRWLSGGDGVF